MNYENHSLIRVLMGWRLTVKTSAKNWSIFYARWLKVDPFETFFNVLWTIDKELN